MRECFIMYIHFVQGNKTAVPKNLNNNYEFLPVCMYVHTHIHAYIYNQLDTLRNLHKWSSRLNAVLSINALF